MLGHVTGDCAPVLAGVVAQLADLVSDGSLGDGAQLCVLHDGDLLADVAVGTDGFGRPLRTDVLGALYCSGKPLTSLAVAQLVEAGALGYESTLGELLGERVSDVMRPVRVRHLLTHTAGLHRLTVEQALLAGPRRRREAALRLGPPAGWRLGEDVAYAEHGAWEVLGEVIAAVTGTTASARIRGHVLAPLGLTGEVVACMTEEEHRSNLHRIGVTTHVQGNAHIPLLVERTRAFCTQEQLGYGARATARGLARLYQHLGEVWAGAAAAPILRSDSLRAMVRSAGPPVHDPILRRACRFGLGLMVDLRTHAFGPAPSPASFGHAGFGGGSYGFADPARALAMAVIFNGHLDGATSVALRRAPVVSAVYRSLGLHPAGSSR